MDTYKKIKRTQGKRAASKHLQIVCNCTHKFKLGYVKKLCGECGEWISVPDPDLIKSQGLIGQAPEYNVKPLPEESL